MNWKQRTIGGVLAAGIAGIASAVGLLYLTPGVSEVRLSGVVETQEVRLSSKIGGRIRKIMIREGEIVEAGTPLVFLDAPELEARKMQMQACLEAAQAQLARSRNGPREEEKEAAHATADVAQSKLDRLRAGYRDEEIAVALAESKAAQSDLDRAQKEWDREVRLQRGGATTAAQSESAFAGVSRLKEQAAASRARWKMLAGGSRPEEIAEAEAECSRTRALARLLDEGTRPEEIAEAEAHVAEFYAKVAELEVQLAEAVVVAPSTARVETIAFRPGDTVAPNQPLVRVLLAEDLWVKAYVPEPLLSNVHVSQKVKIAIDSCGCRTFYGTVGFIAGVSEFTPRNIQTAEERCSQVFAVKIRLLDSANLFKSGMAADVILPLNPKNED